MASQIAKFRVGITLGVIGAAALVAGCGSSNGSSSSTAAAAPAPAASQNVSRVSVSPVVIATTKGPGGVHLTGASGRSVYLWAADSSGKSSCSGACAKVWPPVLTKTKAIVGHGAKADDLGTISRSGSTKQVSYKGHPLYYFAEDAAAGMTKGQGSDSFGAKWWLVAPSGSAITTGAAPAPVSSGSSSSSSSAGGGWG